MQQISQAPKSEIKFHLNFMFFIGFSVDSYRFKHHRMSANFLSDV